MTRTIDLGEATERRRHRSVPLSVLAGFLLVTSAVGGPRASAAEPEGSSDRKWTLSGDFRLRLEQDWDSHTADGDEREDRLRARIRARIGFGYSPTDALSFGLRLRSGSDDSQQSPHVTILDFDHNSTGDADFNFDKAYLRGKWGGFEGWVGRNSLPAWTPNELLWDDDVTPAGIGLHWAAGIGARGNLALNGGYLSLPAGMRAFAGNLALGQAVLSADASGGSHYTLAIGALRFDADPDDPSAAILRQGNGGRDYLLWVGNLQARLTVGGRPLTVGLDYMANSQDYSASDPDPFTAAHRNETDGYDLYVTWGGTGKKGAWLVGLWYAHIEALAVNASYAQDDWVRWGSATQTDSSDLEGVELRAAVGLGQNQSLMARLYLVEAISSPQDGNRLRVDYNVGF
jgi:hypothetical protein